MLICLFICISMHYTAVVFKVNEGSTSGFIPQLLVTTNRRTMRHHKKHSLFLYGVTAPSGLGPHH